MRLKAGQVRKPLALAIGLGFAAAAMSFVGHYVDTSREYPSFIGSLFVYGGLLLGWLVFPAVVSFAARRHYFCWGFIPAGFSAILSGALGVASITDFPPLSEKVYFFLSELPTLALLAMGCVLLSSGPISLIRYVFQRRRSSVIMTEDIASVESAGNEGAWPPEPKRG